MTIQEYIDDCWDSVEDYISGIEDESIVANKWIKLAIKRYKTDLKRKDLHYNVEKVDRVFKFFYFMNINIEDKYQRFELLPFQAFIISSLFGFYYKESGKRKYREVYLQLARKNGKSVFAAALQIFFMMADGVEDPQSLLLAGTREQATICLNYARGIINHSPALEKRLETQRYQILFKDKHKGGMAKVLASNANKLDGYSASGAILDEVHAYPDEELYNVIKSSTLARKNPMIFLITTAGFSTTSFCYNHMKYVQNILEGNIENDALMGMIYSLDDTDSIEDTSVWEKANPAMGHICHLEDLKIEYNSAKYSKSKLRGFVTKHLDLFVDQEFAWIPNETLEVVHQDDFEESELYGEDAYVGMDLSATRDLSCLVVLIKKMNKYYAIPHFFMANNSNAYLRMGGVNLEEWIDAGYITLCSTPTIDYDLIIDKIEEIKSNFNLRMLAYDPFNSSSVITQLHKNGIPVVPFRQTTLKFNEPIKDVEKVIYDKEILLTNPVLKWNINNVIITNDSSGNQKIAKNKSLDSVEGAVCLAMAMGIQKELSVTDQIDFSLWENE